MLFGLVYLIKFTCNTGVGFQVLPTKEYSPLPAPQKTSLQLKQNAMELSCLMPYACKQKDLGELPC